MKYFMIEGMIKNPDLINDNIMKEHMDYSQKAMDKGLIVMAALKSDISGGLFVMRTESIEEVNSYLANEPLRLHEIQDYKIIEFDLHYFNQSLANTLVNN